MQSDRWNATIHRDENMRTRLGTFFGLLAMMLSLTACGSFRPPIPPRDAETLKSERTPGKEIGYGYDLAEKEGSVYRFTLTKFPICREVRERRMAEGGQDDRLVRAAKTIAAAPLVIAWPPLMGGRSIFAAGRNTRQRDFELVGSNQTGRIVSCGADQKAAGEEILVQSVLMERTWTIRSDRNGLINLRPVVDEVQNSAYLNLFIKLEQSIYFVATVFLN